MQVTFPRIVLAEVNTHRALSRNSASSRAIPVERMLRRVEDDPFIPIHWGKNQKGMQADEFLDATDQIAAEEEWLRARDAAVESVRELLALGLHKQIANRLLEPWLWHTAIISATDWSNFFALRCHKDAQPEIQQAALMMRAARNASTPVRKYLGEWH
ncbi:MAG TPA: FAD-dependent thymidylate synthase, partial [Polyangiales bacterium]|nr:FAD-dependent thymidylate synthase [Polyangiales bacterium]